MSIQHSLEVCPLWPVSAIQNSCYVWSCEQTVNQSKKCFFFTISVNKLLTPVTDERVRAISTHTDNILHYILNREPMEGQLKACGISDVFFAVSKLVLLLGIELLLRS